MAQNDTQKTFASLVGQMTAKDKARALKYLVANMIETEELAEALSLEIHEMLAQF